MKSFFDLDLRKLLGTIVGIMLFLGCILFFTFAWYEWRSDNTNVTMTIQDVVIEFENDGDVNVNNIGPVLNYQDGVKSGFRVINGSGGSSSFYVHLDIASISDTLLTEQFKYVLVRDVDGGSDYDYDNPVVSGDFSDFHVGTNVITSTETILGVSGVDTEVVYSYQFIVYMDGNVFNNTNMQGNSMEANLVISDVYRGYLNGVEPGSYVSYTGNSGCPDGHCDGTNAKYVDNTDMGYCGSSSYKFTGNGWRVAYQKDGTAYLVSAGAPECVKLLSSLGDHRDATNPRYFTNEQTFGSYFYATGYTYNAATAQYTLTGLSSEALVWADSYSDIVSNYKYTCRSANSTTKTCYELYEIYSGATSSRTSWYKRVGYADAEEYIEVLNTKALSYCNSEFAYDGVCGVHNAWSLADDDYQLILKNIGMNNTLSSCYNSSTESCGNNYDLISNGSYYWFAVDSGNANYPGYSWNPSTTKLGQAKTNSTLGLRPILRLASTVIVTGGSGTADDPYTIENSVDSVPYLYKAMAGSYVSYEGNNGCPDGHCDGTNANYVSETNMGYCYSSNYKYNSNGWRVAYSKDNTAYLISGGSPECVNSLSGDVKSESTYKDTGETTFGNYYYGTGYSYNESTGIFTLTGVSSNVLVWADSYNDIINTYKYTCKSTSSTAGCYNLREIASISVSSMTAFYLHTSYDTDVNHINKLNSFSLKYCNSNYAYGGMCEIGTSAWNMNESDYQIITASAGESKLLLDCYLKTSTICTSPNQIIDNHGMYWFAKSSTDIVGQTTMFAWQTSKGVLAGYTSYPLGLRPVLRLSSNVIITGGFGTYADPYTISVQ